MKYLIFTMIIFPLLTSSCNRKEISDLDIIHSLSRHYITFLKNSEFYKGEKFLLGLTEVYDEGSLYKAYRLAAEPPLIDPVIVPDDLIKLNETIVICFWERGRKKSNEKDVRSWLQKKGYYNKDALKYSSNYPEWVLLINTDTDEDYLIKDAWYKPLKELITQIDN